MKEKTKLRTILLASLPVFFLSMALHTVLSAQIEEWSIDRMFIQNCSSVGCHSGQYPAAGLNLTKEHFMSDLVDVRSKQLPSMKRVDPGHPQNSYLLMKLRGDKKIQGYRMPFGRDPLSPDMITFIEKWIRGLQSESDALMKSKNQVSSEQKAPPEKPAFWGTRVINLPTPRTIGKGHGLFRISHRYFPSVEEGYKAFYGLDGPAAIQFSFGFGLTDSLDVFMTRTNRFKEVELGLKWTFLAEKKATAFPLSAALYASGSLITQTIEGRDTFSSRNMKFNSILSLAYRVTPSVSIMISPGYTTNANHWEESGRGTFSLGTGVRWLFRSDFSFLVELIPLTSGYKASSPGWGLGLEKKIGGHVFQVFILNTVGMTPSQFLPGSGFEKSGDFRIGFNILRWF
ncbi:DUF5777 family beta-barrel protein [Acidobacteriota bacterium]